jgi:L-asparaginase/Glu-tRNA(Gln) amidotransferase subunit D
MAAVVASGGGAHAESALCEVEAISHGAAYAIEWNPAEEGGVDAALEEAVFDQAADGIVGECCGDGGAQSKAAAQSAGDVIFATALPNGELPRSVHPALAGVKTEHDFAKAEAIPAPIRIRKQNWFHI